MGLWAVRRSCYGIEMKREDNGILRVEEQSASDIVGIDKHEPELRSSIQGEV